MPSAKGWQATISNHLQHYGSVATKALSWLPSWTAGVLVAGLVLLLARRAFRQVVDAEPQQPARAPAEEADADDGTDPHPLLAHTPYAGARSDG
jgi:hypothetical protein